MFLLVRVSMSPSVVLIWLDFGPFSTLPMLRAGSPVIDVAPGRLHPRYLRRFRWGPQSGAGPFNSAQYVSSPMPGIYIGCCCCSGVFDTCRGLFTPVRSPCRLCSARSCSTLFRCSGFQTGHLQARWVREYDPPASPSTLTSPSLCLNLDTLSSDGSAAQGMSLLTSFVSLMCHFSPGTWTRYCLVTIYHRVLTLT